MDELLLFLFALLGVAANTVTKGQVAGCGVLRDATRFFGLRIAWHRFNVAFSLLRVVFFRCRSISVARSEETRASDRKPKGRRRQMKRQSSTL